jgi:hypothetical protein
LIKTLLQQKIPPIDWEQVMGKSVALMLVLVLAASSVVFVLPIKGEARTIVVPDDYPTIGAAIENASEGDTIYVKIGIYEETTLTVNKSISLIGDDRMNTILKLDPPYGKPTGFHLAGSGVETEYGYYEAIKIEADNVKVSGLTINCTQSSIFVMGNGTQITNNNLPGVVIIGSGTRITNNNLTSTFLQQGKDSTVTGNFIQKDLISESGDSIIANNIMGSLFSTGSNVHLEKNCVSSGFIFDSNHRVEGNIIMQFGMNIRGYENTVFNNTIINTELAVGFGMDAANNTIFHNNFINNTRKVQMSSFRNPRTHGCMAVWDRGYDIGGNYWSDYLSKYPNATEIDGSGFGNTPYVIDADNQDNYPLMRPVDIDFRLLSMLPFSISSFVTDYVPPKISVLSPKSQTYNETSVSLVFSVDEAVNWTGYSLNGKDNVTITGNATLADLPNGLHNVTVYANDTFGNMGMSKIINFTITIPQPFPVVPIAIGSAVAIVAIATTLLVYFKKRRKEAVPA